MERNPVRRIGSGAPLLALSIVVSGVLLASGCGQQPTQPGAESHDHVTTSGTNQSPQEVLITSDVVQNYFPELARQHTPTENPDAAGTPEATRMAIYEGDDGRKVTLSADRYPSSDSASAAFELAIDKSEAVQGFVALPAPVDIGDRAFAGIVSQGDDTHIGYGALTGEYVIGVTSAGYPATTENTARLIDLTRAAVERAQAAQGHS